MLRVPVRRGRRSPTAAWSALTSPGPGEQSGDAGADDVEKPAHAKAHHGPSTRQRFERRERQIVVRRGKGDEVGRAVDQRQKPLVAHAAEMDVPDSWLNRGAAAAGGHEHEIRDRRERVERLGQHGETFVTRWIG